MPVVVDSVTAEGLLTYSSRVSVPTTQATANSTLSLTVTSTSVQYFTGTTAGQIIEMPNATTIPIGHRYEIFNASTQVITVHDNSGALLVSVATGTTLQAILQIAGSAAGTWLLAQTTANGIANYNVVSSTSFATSSATDVQITGFSVVPVAGTYLASFSGNAALTGSGADSTCTLYLGAVAIADSPRVSTSGSGGHKLILSTQTIAQWDGIAIATVYVKTTGSMTITGRSLGLIRLGN